VTIQTSVFLDSDEISNDTTNITVRRGRSLESESFDAGGGVITVENFEANFNPAFLSEPRLLLQENDEPLLQENLREILLESGNGTSGGAYGEIRAGREVTIVDGSTTVFTGYVEDFDYNWNGQLRPTASLTVRDHLAALGATSMNEWTPSQQLTGARVSAVLNRADVAFPSGSAFRDIATGTQPLRRDDVAFGTNALRYLQQVNASESGRLFVDRTGKLVFQDRYAAFGITPAASFNDTETAIPFYGITVRFGTELLHFQVSVDRGEGVTQTSTRSGIASQFPQLGLRSLTRRTLLNSDDHAFGLADFLVGRYSLTRAVVSGLRVWLNALSSSDRQTVCELDIGDVVSLTWTPQGTAGPVAQTLAIEGVTYTCRASDAWIDFQLSDASDPDYFVVNTDSVNGPERLAP
jgi:hypothetical protein